MDLQPKKLVRHQLSVGVESAGIGSSPYTDTLTTSAGQGPLGLLLRDGNASPEATLRLGRNKQRRPHFPDPAQGAAWLALS